MSRILTFGVFDYFHLGHLRLFKQCKEYADYLIVAVQNGEFIQKYKPSSKVLYSTSERLEMLEALRIVDEVIVYNTVSCKFLDTVDFDILALGEDHVGERFAQIEDWCQKNNKEIVRLKRTEGICSSNIKREIQ